MYINNPAQGKPISNGKMYFGEPDLDPEIFTNQKQVYYIQENGDLVAASQPITLSAGGNPTYNGDAVTLSITGEYSTKVLNKLGVQEYYIARTDSSGDSGSVITYAEDSQILSSGQLIVDFTGITVAVANIYVGKNSGDRGKLFEGDDYTVTGGSQITLTSSFNTGTKLIAASSELVERDSLAKELSTAYEFSTVAVMKASPILFPLGKTIRVKSNKGASAKDVKGAADYKILSLIEFGGTPDEYGDHTLASGNVAKLVTYGVIYPELFGAFGDGVTDDSLAIQAMLDYDGEGEIRFTQGVTYVATDLIASNVSHIRGFGSLLLRPPSSLASDYILSIVGDGSTVKGLNFDGNASNNVGHTSRSEGLRVLGNNVVVSETDSSNTPIDGTKTANCYYIAGENCILKDTSSSNAGYAACRVDGENCKVIRPNYLNFAEKGITFNGSGKNQFTIEDPIAIQTNSTHPSAQAPILIDAGSARVDQLRRFYGKNLTGKCTGGITGSNVCKIVNTRFVTIDGFDFQQTTSNFASLRFQELVEYITLTNGRTDGEINFDSFDYKKVTMTNVNVGREDKTLSVDVPISGVYAKEGFFAENISVYNATSGLVRMEDWVGQTDTDGNALTEPYLNINGVVNDSSVVTTPILFIDIPSTNITPGNIIVTGVNVVTGIDTFTQMITGNSTTERLIQRNQSATSWERQFLSASVPTTNAWKVNDKVSNATPLAGGAIGWVNIVSGTPGTWKTFGTIGS